MTDQGSLFEMRVETVNRNAPERWAELIETFPDLLPRFVDAIAKQHEGSLKSILKVLPGEPVDPWPWVSERQRIAFHFTDGFGGGIPHVRGGADSLEENWQVEVQVQDELTTSIAVVNTAVNIEGFPYGGFVMGWESQPGFIQTGWMQIPDFMEIVAYENEDMFQDFIVLADDAIQNWKVTD